MIKIKCGSCGRILGVPEKFAGKRIHCPKCKASINVPAPTESGGTQQETIKFHCPKCSQKIGLPANYAGKQVRCAKCRNLLRVPDHSTSSKPSPVPAGESPQIDNFNPFADLPDSELLQLKPLNGPAQDPLKLSPLKEPSKGGDFTDIPGLTKASGGASYAVSDLMGHSTGLNIDNTPLALLASVIFVIIGGMAWGLIAKYAHMELGLVAWAIGVLAGLGVYWFTASRGVLLGIAVALIAFFGILCGKYFIAKWYYMPKLMAEFRKKDAPSFIDPNNIKLSQQDIKRIMANPGQMFGLVAMQLADDGEITKEDADYFVMGKFGNIFWTDDRQSEKPKKTEREETESKHKEQESKVYKCLAEWDEQKKTDAIKTQYPKMMKKYTDAFTKSRVMNVIGFAVAYIAAFSIFDLIWFPLTMVTAYKFGTGESG